MILLIHPPVAKISEAPGGPAALAGALRRHGVSYRIWDANLEGQLALFAAGAALGTGESDAWSRRAAKHLRENLAALRSWEIYANGSRYRRAVTDLNRLLALAGRPSGTRLSLKDCEADGLSPVSSANLMKSAALPEASPFYSWFSGRIEELLADRTCSHVGFSLNYLSQAVTAFAMIGFIRRSHPAVRIILGGGLVTSWLRSPGWRNPLADLVDEWVAGPGEVPLLTLLGKSPAGESSRPDLEGFPLGDYLAPGTVLPYSASRGCWWRRCSFCPEQSEASPYVPVPARRAAEELRLLVEETRPVLVHLLDNALSPTHLDALAAVPLGAPWYGFTRITPQLASREFCAELKDAGCVMLKLGLESADQCVLDALQKGIDLRIAATVLDNLEAVGIATYVYLLFGTPAETQRAARRTMDFIAAHAGAIGFLNCAIFNLPAAGSEAETLDAEPFYEGDLSLYRSFVHPQGWDRGKVRRFLEREFKREPAIAEILRREPPHFTSNHAPFVIMAGRPSL